MATNSKILEIVIQAKDEASKTLNSLSTSLKNSEKAFTNMAKVGAVAFAGVTAVIATSVNAYAEAERSQRQLEHAILDISKGTRQQVEEVNNLTTALQKKAGIDGDALNAGIAQLSTFGLQSASVVALTKSLADLTVNQKGVTAGADDYINSANIMAKALRGEFGMLSKMGIRFTETQQNLIMFGTETEKIATIQEGFAQNLRETTDTVAGYDVALARIKQTFGDVQESIGKGLQPAITRLSEVIVPLIQQVADWTSENPQLTANILLVVGAVSLLLIGLGALGLALPAIIAGFAFLTPTVFAVIGIITGLGIAIYNIVNIFNILKNDLDLVWLGIKTMFKEGVDYIIELFNPLFQTIDRVKSALSSIGSSIKGAVTSVTNKITGKKATGGGVQTGGSYLVGEQGPEIFSPASNGSIIPNYKLAGAGGGNITVNINGGTYLDRNVAEEIGDMIIKNFRKVARF